MKTYLIERHVAGLGHLPSTELTAIAARSKAVLAEIGDGIEWLHSYVTGDHFYCLYRADDRQRILDHARRGGFPADRILEVGQVIDPATA